MRYHSNDHLRISFKNLVISALNTHDSTSLNDSALQKNILKYPNDEYDHSLCFLAAESDSDIRFPPSRLDFAAHEVTIFRKQ